MAPYIPDLLALAAVFTVAVITPGPDFLAVSHTTLTRSRRDGVFAALGVTLGMACWALAALTGLDLLFSHWPWLFATVKTLGAIYLLVLGVQLVLNASGLRGDGPGKPQSKRFRGRAFRQGRAFRRGLLTNLANPKALVLFGSLITEFIPTHPTIWVQTAIFTLIVGITLVWYTGLALAFSIPRISALYELSRRGVERVCGGLFLFLGVRFAVGD